MSRFGKEARKLQGQFRSSSLTISSQARRPSDDKGIRHKHLLALGCEQENLFPSIRGSDGAIAFFRKRGIQWWKSTRSGDDYSTEGPSRNLASSQASCLNFLLPLAKFPDALNALLQRFNGDEESIAPIVYSWNGSSMSSLVEFEWVGLTTTLEGTTPKVRGANVTSADALVFADLSSVGRRAYVVEWKYVEEYKSGEYKGEGSAGVTRRDRYSGFYSSPSSPFRPEVPFDEWLYEPFYQIMRLLLLAQKMIDENELGVTEASVIVVCPEENDAYRNRITSPDFRARYSDATSVAEVVKNSLRDPGRFRIISQEDLLTSIATSSNELLDDWFMYHQERYGWAGEAAGA